MEKLETKYVSIDTQFFVIQNFLDGNLIKELSPLVGMSLKVPAIPGAVVDLVDQQPKC